jgi:hypothetical protein
MEIVMVNDYAKMTGREWSELLSEHPQYADKCDWDKLDGDDWVYLLNTDSNRSANSLRLDYNETERKNRALLKWDDAVGYWGEPWPWKQAKEPDIWFNVNDDSWLSSCAPNRFMRNSNGEFVPVVGAP